MPQGAIEDAKARFPLYAGVLLAFMGTAGNALGVEPFRSLFHIFAWWSYILLSDAVVYGLKGESLIVSRTEEFLFLLPWSVFIWFIFELANVRLGSWGYMFVPSETELRRAGYYLSGATILPGLFVTAETLSAIGLFKSSAAAPLRITPRLLDRLTAAGAASLALPLLMPRYFFALLWVAFPLLLEPLCYRLRLRSLLRDLERGDARRSLRLLASGAAYGLLLGLWNHMSGSKTVYTAPLAGKLELFGTPLTAYLAFPLLALGCYAMYNLATYLRCGRSWEENAQEPLPGVYPSPRVLLAAALALAAVLYLTPPLIDARTVRLYVAGF
ncbi:MAG TPA: hypothetical protein PL037_02345 [Elusimicrobiales bacterium]|nr:hypothetical protein [Elusimicrobiales bacterium]